MREFGGSIGAPAANGAKSSRRNERTGRGPGYEVFAPLARPKCCQTVHFENWRRTRLDRIAKLNHAKLDSPEKTAV